MDKQMEISRQELRARLTSLSGVTGSVHDLFKAYSGKGAALNIRILALEPGEEGVPSVLIEGDKNAILFLADLMLAQTLDSDCGVGISPTGPGNVFFSRQSELGIYVHVLPCKNQKLAAKRTDPHREP